MKRPSLSSTATPPTCTSAHKHIAQQLQNKFKIELLTEKGINYPKENKQKTVISYRKEKNVTKALDILNCKMLHIAQPNTLKAILSFTL